MNLRFYFNKVRITKENFFSNNLPRQIGTKRNKFGISVIVLDLKTKQSYEYVSIAEAARSFNTHPKTIWRIVYHNKLYLNRYQIIEKKSKQLWEEKHIYIFYKYVCLYFHFLFKVIKSNKIFIYRIFLFFILGFSIGILILFFLIVFKDIYGQYIFALHEGKINYNRCVLEHKILLTHVLNANSGLINKSNLIGFRELRYEFLFNYKWIYDYNNEIGIYQSIINEINYDFNIDTGTFSGINSSYSSPIIERVNINNIFSNAIASTSTVNDTTSSLGIQGINYGSNRNFVIVDNLLINTKLRSTELLNYQSNILYCLINGLSPSIY